MTGPAVHVSLTPLSQVDERIAGRWQALADRAIEPNPFAGPDMALPAAAHLPCGHEARLLAAWRGADLVFALPVLHRRGYRHLPLTTLQAWQHPYAFLGTPLLDPIRSVDTCRAVLGMLRDQRLASWLVIEDMAVDGEVAAAMDTAAMDTAAGGRGCHSRQLDRRTRPVAYRDESPPTASGSSRRSAAKRRRRLEKAIGGEVVLVDRAASSDASTGGIGDDRNLGDAIECFLELEASGWKGRAGTALRADPAASAFFRQLCQRHAAREALRLVALQAGGRAAAMICMLVAGDATFCFKIGHDDSLDHVSPGSQLLTDVVAAFHDSQKQLLIDSCAERLGTVTEHLFPAARTIATLIVPTGTRPGVIAARTLPHLVRLRRAVAGRAITAEPSARE